MNLSASSRTCANRYSMSKERPCRTSSLSEEIPTDSATSLILSGFQTDILGAYLILDRELICFQVAKNREEENLNHERVVELSFINERKTGS